MNQIQYTALGQNRIDYIVFHNIKQAQKLLYDEGFESPEDPYDLVEAIKELIREKGREVIKALLKIHPDKNAILAIADTVKVCENCKTKISDTKKKGCSSCKKKGCASCEKATVSLEDNYTTDSEELEATTPLDDLVNKYKASPSKELEKEIEARWNSIRLTPKKELKEKPTTPDYGFITKKELAIYTSIFGLGLLLGIGFTYSKNS
ncbi:hypothetical protein ACFO3O_06315 [Dokdonia ponticola]|uniref:Zinc ribbon domain-containing protein n=1 Tax=Dokdonia ponticola TaxID=2041041 RepID=A0ABV9HTH2_9FLAO